MLAAVVVWLEGKEVGGCWARVVVVGLGWKNG